MPVLVAEERHQAALSVTSAIAGRGRHVPTRLTARLLIPRRLPHLLRGTASSAARAARRMARSSACHGLRQAEAKVISCIRKDGNWMPASFRVWMGAVI